MSIAMLFCEPRWSGYRTTMGSDEDGSGGKESMPKRRPLTPAERADKQRLHEWFKKWQAEVPGRTQATLGAKFGFKSPQSAVSGFLTGPTPLNPLIVSKFAVEFGCAPEEISPRIGAEIRFIVDSFAYWPFARIRLDRIRALSEADLSFLEGALLSKLEDVEKGRSNEFSSEPGESPESLGKARRSNGK